MLLAGGQGSRLGVLTQRVAKPAVPFGGKYRIIDFPLSNCSNSGIDVVGVLTQYQPMELNSYIGTGMPWDLDRLSGGVYVLPPYMTGPTGSWYRGTANAICQNIGFIEQFDPEYVLILSGDHIYKMDYEAMLRHHIDKKADCTIAVREVPWEEASRYGIMNSDESGRIVEFEEKPKAPKSNKASMGIYIFSWKLFRQYLLEDDADPASSNDFGKDVIPKMLSDGRSMSAYDFVGYWKDVGTIESLWEAHMDLLRDPPYFNLYDTAWRIYSRTPLMPPHYVKPGAVVRNSMVTEGSYVAGQVENSILFFGSRVEKGATVRNSVLMPNCRVEEGAIIDHAIIAERSVVGEHVIVKGLPGKIAVVGADVTLRPGSVVGAGDQVDAHSAGRFGPKEE